MARAKADRKEMKLPDIRVTKREYDEVMAGAKERDLSITDWLRVLIFRRIPKHRMKKLQLIDTSIVSELSRQGGNIRSLYNDFAKTGKFFPEETRRVLHDIDMTVMKIKRVYDIYLERELLKNDRQSDPPQKEGHAVHS